MTRVKILEYCDSSNQCDCENYNTFYSLYDQSEWDFVTDDELQVLREWAKDNNDGCGNKIVIVTEKNIDVKKTVKEYLEKIKIDNQIKAERQKKKLEKEAKKKKTLELKKELKKQVEEKKLLEELQSKYCLVK